MLRPAFSASARQRCSSRNSPASSGSSFFVGCRSTPGITPATSQLDWLISITAISVLFSSRAASDLLNACPGAGRGHLAVAWGTPSVFSSDDDAVLSPLAP